MTEEEIMQRAREAAIAVGDFSAQNPGRVRSGRNDGALIIKCAAQALRDASKPLAEIAPSDPDRLEAKRIVEEYGLAIAAEVVEIGIKRGRELERGQ